MIKHYICIACPLGCRLTLDVADPADPAVTGQKCPRGKTYAISEHSDPRRVVTTTVPSTSSLFPRIPVKTDRPLPKALIDDLLRELHGREIPLPVKRGDVVIQDFRKTGVRVVIARSLSE